MIRSSPRLGVTEDLHLIEVSLPAARDSTLFWVGAAGCGLVVFYLGWIAPTAWHLLPLVVVGLLVGEHWAEARPSLLVDHDAVTLRRWELRGWVSRSLPLRGLQIERQEQTLRLLGRGDHIDLVGLTAEEQGWLEARLLDAASRARELDPVPAPPSELEHLRGRSRVRPHD